MQFDAVLIDPRRAAMVAAGYWRDEILLEYLERWSTKTPNKEAIISFNSQTGKERRITYGELSHLADRIALALVDLGVARGDVVSFQLPNWWEFNALHLACLKIGAVSNPLMPFFRQRELSFMLDFAATKILVIPETFRGHHYPSMIDDIRDDLPKLEQVLVVGGLGDDAFETHMLERQREQAADALQGRAAQPDDVVQLLYTSGTTGEPKGVMHTSNTLLSNLVHFTERLGLGQDDVIHMPSPLAHQLGFMYGLMMPVMLGATVVLQDAFTAEKMAEQIIGERATFTMAATPFLSDLTEFIAGSRGDTPSLKIFVSAGAPIPRALVEKATDTLGANIISAWGMTENGAVTTTKPDDKTEKIFNTDGCPLPGMALKIVDDEGAELSRNTVGQLHVRGCSQFGGYLHRPNLNNTNDDGWFDTGDLAAMDDDGYIRIAGRSKDIIIRGGENIPVVEIEGLLYKHPAISQVAIVGYADARLGERACAFVVPRDGAPVTLADVVDFLLESKVAKQYIPERLEVIAEMPCTPSGKIQKFRLREIAAAFAES